MKFRNSEFENSKIRIFESLEIQKFRIFENTQIRKTKIGKFGISKIQGW